MLFIDARLLRRLVSVEVAAGPIDDDRHDYPHPHRPPPRAQNPPRPGARESGVAAPTDRPLAHRAASAAPDLRSPALGPAVPPVAWLGGCRLHRPTRDCHPVAARRLHALLDLEEPPEQARAPGRRAGGPSADPTNVSRQPPVGCAADSRGTPEAGPRDRAGDGLQVSGPPPGAAVADLAHVPRQPPPEPGLRGLLHRAHGDVQGVVRLRCPGAPQETRRACQRYRRPHGPVDGPGARRGVPLGHRTALLAARSRWALRGRVLAPRALPGDPRRQDAASVPLAESVRGTPHWNPTPRVPRPYDRAQRDPPASAAARLPCLLPQRPDAPLPEQGLPGTESGAPSRPGQNRWDALVGGLHHRYTRLAA